MKKRKRNSKKCKRDSKKLLSNDQLTNLFDC